ncbi:sugar transferase [Terriglobus roseus]|uniref:sugar transferase n=1 Tax=Terriglobus roseus TaxID=392734 RepID=UPI001BAFC1BA|nr:sugar transferase [Terriglobus roseus]
MNPKLADTVLWSRQRFVSAMTLVEVLVDLTTIAFAVLFSYWLYQKLHIGKTVQYRLEELIIATVAFAVMYVVLLDRDGAYAPASSLLGIRETERVLRVSVMAFSTVFFLNFLWAHQLSRAVLAGAVVMVPLALACVKQLKVHLVRTMHARGYGIQNVIIYGGGATGRRIFSALVHSPKLGLQPVAIIDDDERLADVPVYDSGYRRQHSLRITRGPVTRDLIRSFNATLLLIGIPSIDCRQRDQAAAEAFAEGCNVSLVPALNCGAEMSAGYVDVDGLLISSLAAPSARRSYDLGKRVFDLSLSAVMLVLLLPLWAAIALAIRLDSAGPVFFTQDRIGKNGFPFCLYKFRSMRIDAPKYGFHPQSSHDPRVTRVGRWLRRTSLDELPQLLNIFRGEMSLVGPRPEMPFIVESYSDLQRQRLQVTPGLTGLWQLSADRAFLIHENPQYDAYYIRHRNFFMDVALLLHTVMFAMRGV